ncbi:MAG: peroxiredoxin [Gammaproteobacteria bacterium]
MLKPGDTAPDFELPDQDGNQVQLADLLAHGPVLLYFYPADFTPICTREACSFRELSPGLNQKNVTLIGISPQDSASHIRFRARHQLNFPLLADTDKRVIRAYGCDGPFGFGVKRVSYLIGRDRRIQETVHAAFRVSRHTTLAHNLLNKP